MNDTKIKVLEEWLRIDLCKTASKMGLTHSKVDATDNLIMQTVRCLDYESLIEENPSVNYIITIIGLMWEHIDHKKYDIRKLIIKCLSRVGYPTSAIICDDAYNKEQGSFSMLDSWIDEVTSAIYQIKNEVSVSDQKYLLTNFQKQIWDSMDHDKILGISAPTSAGKSFVILLKLCERLRCENLDIVYIVPTLSLLTQVTEDFNRELKKAGIENYCISNTFDENQSMDVKNIYVMTQEKAIAAFSDSDKVFSKKLILVADEIQNIERIKEDTDERAKILFDTLIEFRYRENVEQIIISGPRIEKIDKVGKNIFGIETKDHTTNTSPVLNMTYSIKKDGNRYFLKQYCSLTDNPQILEIDHPEIIEGYGQRIYTEKYMSYLSILVNNAGKGAQNIIFAPTSATARKIAIALEGCDAQVEEDLIEYYSNTIRSNYSLCKTLKKGVAYHHGKLPQHVRRTLEKAISEKKISNVVCTTTLLQGVNLPAQNVYIRNPHLYIRKQNNSAELTNYEMANLRGRAGRLLKDYIGRAFVLDESEFIDTEGYEQLELFEDVTKELPTGYAQKYEEYKEPIGDVLDKNIAVDPTMQKYGYIISYIRQSVLKYGPESKRRMQDVGIKLTQKQVAAIIHKLEEISVPKEICYKNRYWDPIVLDTIYKTYNGSIPNTPMERNAKSRLDDVLRYLRDTDETASMYNKYIPKQYKDGNKRSIMISLGLKWAKGDALNDILSGSWYEGDEGEEHIDDTIELLQNTISYGLPLLLKPIYDMKNPDSCFLTCMQLGAFDQLTRCMIEMGIPRETALFLYKKIFAGNDLKDIKNGLEIEKIVRNRIKESYYELPYWIRVQVDFLI